MRAGRIEAVPEEFGDAVGCGGRCGRIGQRGFADRHGVDGEIDAAERQERGWDAIVGVGVLEEDVELLPGPLGAIVDSRFPPGSRVAIAGQFVALGEYQEDREAADLAGAGFPLRHHGEEGIELLEGFLEFVVVRGGVNQQKDRVGRDDRAGDRGAGVGVVERRRVADEVLRGPAGTVVEDERKWLILVRSALPGADADRVAHQLGFGAGECGAAIDGVANLREPPAGFLDLAVERLALGLAGTHERGEQRRLPRPRVPEEEHLGDGWIGDRYGFRHAFDYRPVVPERAKTMREFESAREWPRGPVDL